MTQAQTAKQSQTEPSREERVAAALRENLRKRKQQQQARGVVKTETPVKE